MTPLRTERPRVEHRASAARLAGMLLAFAITLATFLQAVVSARAAVGVAVSFVLVGVAVLATVEARAPTWTPDAADLRRPASPPSRFHPRHSAR